MLNFYNNKIEDTYSKETGVQYRRSLGQFFTPFKVAVFMAEWILQNQKGNLRILDPGAGFGVFEKALEYKNKRKSKKLKFDLWEIDENISEKLAKIVSSSGIEAKILTNDFLLGSWEEKYDGIIANPPYYKHHYIKNKNKIYKKISNKTFFKFSIQTNIYCWFLIKSMDLLRPGGRLAFIVPSEFLNANYGEKVKAYLMQSGLVIHLINISFKQNIFDNALITSAIVFGEKRKEKNEKINFYNVNDIKEIADLSRFLEKHPKKPIAVDKLDSKLKWRNYFNGYEKSKQDDRLIPFSKIGHFSRGIATGANQYFTLSKKEKTDNSLPDECLVPCVTKANHIKDIRFTQENFNKLVEANKKVFLFDGEESNAESCKNYIKKGKDRDIDKRYLTKNREPWYALEKREVSKIWVSVFQRHGLKFIWNETNCVNLTCFHSFYPNKLGEKYLDILFLYSNTDFAKKLFDREKREYGNGLEKFEPNDINKALAFDFETLSRAISEKLREMQTNFLFSADERRKEILKKADNIFKRAFQSS